MRQSSFYIFQIRKIPASVTPIFDNYMSVSILLGIKLLISASCHKVRMTHRVFKPCFDFLESSSMDLMVEAKGNKSEELPLI